VELAGNYTFDAPREMVWIALQDPKVLGSVMPGGQGFAQVAANHFDGVLQIKVGPVQGAFEAQIKLTDVQPLESYRIEVHGKGAPGFVRASGDMRLDARDGKTLMEYAGHAQIGGRIATVGQRLLDTTARSIIRQGLDGLNEYLKVQVARQAQEQGQAAAGDGVADAAVADAAGDEIAQAPPAQAPPDKPTSERYAFVTAQAPASTINRPTYKPTSQSQMAINVARDVLNDLIPARYQPFVAGAVISAIMLLIWLVIRRGSRRSRTS
jgi:carbon monoxide dehydrogenase subunit G